MVLIIDNYDSFTYNLVQGIGALRLDDEIKVVRNDAATVAELGAMKPTHLVISPGPCTPNEGGISVDAVRHFAGRIPVLGVCLGAQILGKSSEEGDEPGLGWIDMECKRLPETDGLRVPHMSWNQIMLQRPCQLFPDLQPDTRYYFVHSYYISCKNPDDVVATAQHGIEFACAVQRDNIFGTQFHPEKSLRHGLALMRAFDAL